MTVLQRAEVERARARRIVAAHATAHAVAARARQVPPPGVVIPPPPPLPPPQPPQAMMSPAAAAAAAASGFGPTGPTGSGDLARRRPDGGGVFFNADGDGMMVGVGPTGVSGGGQGARMRQQMQQQQQQQHHHHHQASVVAESAVRAATMMDVTGGGDGAGLEVLVRAGGNGEVVNLPASGTVVSNGPSPAVVAAAEDSSGVVCLGDVVAEGPRSSTDIDPYRARMVAPGSIAIENQYPLGLPNLLAKEVSSCEHRRGEKDVGSSVGSELSVHSGQPEEVSVSCQASAAAGAGRLGSNGGRLSAPPSPALHRGSSGATHGTYGEGGRGSGVAVGEAMAAGLVVLVPGVHTPAMSIPQAAASPLMGREHGYPAQQQQQQLPMGPPPLPPPPPPTTPVTPVQHSIGISTDLFHMKHMEMTLSQEEVERADLRWFFQFYFFVLFLFCFFRVFVCVFLFRVFSCIFFVLLLMVSLPFLSGSWSCIL